MKPMTPEEYMEYETQHAAEFKVLDTILNEILEMGHEQGALAFLLPLDLLPELSHYLHIPVFHSKLAEPKTMYCGQKEPMLRYLREYDHD
jgi:hypothetical protein